MLAPSPSWPAPAAPRVWLVDGLTKGVRMARFARRVLLVSVALLATLGIATASADAPTITGYPNQINKVDLTGYTIQTSYSLGRNAGHTFVQVYDSSSTVIAHQVLPGPFCCF